MKRWLAGARTFLAKDPHSSARSSLGMCRFYNPVVVHAVISSAMLRLRGYAGVTIAGYPLEVDGFAIDRWAKQGEIDFEDIYAS